jgi:ribosomal protein L24E
MIRQIEIYRKIDYLLILFRRCNTCKKEFNEYLEGAYYSSAAGLMLYFCSDECTKNYFNKQTEVLNEEEKRIQT